MIQQKICRPVKYEKLSKRYNPKKMNALLIRQRNPKGTALVYAGGKVMLTGSDSVEDAKLCGKKVAKTIQQCGYPDVKFAGFQCENLVCMLDLRFPIRLEGVAYSDYIMHFK